MKNLAIDTLKTKLTNDQTALWYLGQEGFIIKHKSGFLAIDPYLSDYVDKNCCQFVKWKRLYPAPVKAEKLNFLNAVLCTHSHFDHMDPWTLSKIAKANPQTKFIVPAPEAQTIVSYGIKSENVILARADEPIYLNGFKITPIPSAHEVFHTDENGNYKELGYIINDGKNKIFHAGDMCMYDGLIPRLKNIDVAILPVNGRDYFRNANDIIGNFDCGEAIILAKKIKAKLLIPVHHDLYEVNRVNAATFVDTLNSINKKQPYHIFTPSEKYIYAK